MQEKTTERRSNAARTAETTEKFVAIARALFAEKGYANTSTPEIVKAAGVTRGALYHHFGDKQGLFRAVIEREAALVADDINSKSINSETPKQALLDGALAYFDAMAVDGRAELLLIEGPAVLGFEAMSEIDQRYGGNELKIGLDTAVEQGVLPSMPTHHMADILSAAFDRAALASAKSPDQSGQYIDAFKHLFMALFDYNAKTKN
ncbi:MAG: TetR/AcrR family transcriptional regulator [Lentilitoribacter sp.]